MSTIFLENLVSSISAFFGVRTPHNYNISILLSVLISIGAIFQNIFFEHYSHPTPKTPSMLFNEYDFIIIGGGSAGAVVANRLSENKNWTVLLIEAGELETAVSEIPIMAQYLQLTDLDWQYKTEPSNQFCLAMKNQQCNWPRGKVLGGSSVLNYMMYVRGNKRDFDTWEQLGNVGWGYDDVLHYFKKSEDIRIPSLIHSPYHSRGGYLTVEELSYRTPLGYAFIHSSTESGLNIIDYNGKQHTGYSFCQTTTRRGARCSTAKAFIDPVGDRLNLHILLKSHVTRILINPQTKTAYGVEFYHEGRFYQTLATKEVILSAGALNSPQILMLSGVGPAEHLSEMHIPLIQNLSVGYNLQDHVGVGGLTFMINQPVSLIENAIHSLKIYLEYGLFRKGPLTMPGGIEAVGFINTKYANPEEDYPDIQLLFVPGSSNSDSGRQLRRAHGLSYEFYKNTYGPILDKHSWCVIPYLLRPRSSGMVRLKNNNPFEKPRFYPNYFAERIDMLTLIESVKSIIAMSKTEAFQQFGSKISPYPFDGCTHLEFLTDDYIECTIRHYTFTIYHQSGTCKMGPGNDPEAVVDSRLRVYGIKRLRVIDASIMPNVVSGNINAAAIMIGEKGSDMVKQMWLTTEMGRSDKDYVE